MLAGGYDRAAARWASAIGDMDDEPADRCWAMLALAHPNAVSLGIAGTRLSSFIRRDDSPGKRRSGLLVAGGAIDEAVDVALSVLADDHVEAGNVIAEPVTGLLQSHFVGDELPFSREDRSSLKLIHLLRGVPA